MTTKHAGYDTIKNDTDSDRDIDSSHREAQLKLTTQANKGAVDQPAQIAGSNPKEWIPQQVRKWLHEEGLDSLLQSKGGPLSDTINGQQLLNLRTDDFKDARSMNSERDSRSKNIERLFREIPKLQASAEGYEVEQHTNLHHVTEMRRRMKLFIEKWDRILWIKHYEDINNKKPTREKVALELGLSVPLSEIYLEYYENMERYREKDLNELFCNFDVYKDCVIWWYLIVTQLKSYPSPSLWIIFPRVALITPHNVSIRLLQKYQQDLTRFDAKELDKVTQQIVIGSTYPVCTALAIAKWFKDRAELDVARCDLFKETADLYIQSAIEYLDIVESDHLKTILLEAKSDIDNMSALDMALEYELVSFTTNHFIERIITSVMNDWEFLRPENRESSFEINPLTLLLVWDKLYKTYKVFYLTPLGTYATTFFLYICYLVLFTALSLATFHAYSYPMNPGEIMFWIFNTGYVVNEFIELCFSEGWVRYYSKPSNRFDTVISVVFVASLCTRIAGIVQHQHNPPCNERIDPPIEAEDGDGDPLYLPCWYGTPLNITFTILWAIATVTLYLRVLTFFILSRNLGPMVQMIFDMADDIVTFFEIMIIVFCGFVVALMPFMQPLHTDFDTVGETIMTLFRAALGDFDFDQFSKEEDFNAALLQVAHIFVIVYMVIAALVLLNILIAMMAKTFDTIHDDTVSTLSFGKFRLAHGFASSTTFMPPPLNVIAMVGIALFYFIETPINWLRYLRHRATGGNADNFQIWDLSLLLMPRFMKTRKLALDQQIVNDDPNAEYKWKITTSEGPTFCRFTKFDADKMKHTVEFARPRDSLNGSKMEPLAVSVDPYVEKRDEWELNLLELIQLGLLDEDQFEVAVDQEWINHAHKYSTWREILTFTSSDEQQEAEDEEAPLHFICAFCRAYVKESKMSIPRLGNILQLNAIEMSVVYKQSPKVCPNCYRVREERDRLQLVGEIVSYWIFYLFVGPLLICVIALLMFFLNPIEYCRYFRDHIVESLEGGNGRGCLHRLCRIQENPQNCTDYYDSATTANLAKQSNEDFLFDEKAGDNVWNCLQKAQQNIEPHQLRDKINVHMIHISSDTTLTEFAFLDQFVRIHELEHHDHHEVKKICKAIFHEIQETQGADLSLHMFRQYPFDALITLQSLQEIWISLKRYANGKYEEEQKRDCFDEDEADEACPMSPHLMDCNEAQLIEALVDLETYGNRDDCTFIVNAICESDDYADKKTVYLKLVKFLHEIEAVFQNNQKMKTLLRDIENALKERGIDLLVSKEELQFLCQDINEITVVPLFNAMRKLCEELDASHYKHKLYLWDIRNNLICIDMLQQTVKDQLLHKHCTIKISRQDLKKDVLDLFQHDIIMDDDARDNEDMDDQDFHGKNALANSGSVQKTDESDDVNVPTLSRRMSTIHDVAFTHSISSPLQFSVSTTKHTMHHRMAPSKSELNIRASLKNKIIKQTLLKLIDVIFEKMQQQQRISVTSINTYYVTKIIRSHETLQYIYQQLKRYTAFQRDQKQLEQPCSVQHLIQILCKERKFGNHGKYYIDEETIPEPFQIHETPPNPAQVRSMDMLTPSAVSDANTSKKPNKSNQSLAEHIIKSLQQHYITIYRKAEAVKHQPTLAKNSTRHINRISMRGRKAAAGLNFTMTRVTEEADSACSDQWDDTEDDPDAEELKNELSVQSTKETQAKSPSPPALKLVALSSSLSSITTNNILTIAMLYDRIHRRVRRELLNIIDVNTMDHDTFVQFVEPNPQRKQKRDEATSLFHAVLCTQQNVVSLGQVRKTIHSLIDEVDAMQCGGLLRIMNHLHTQIEKDKKKMTEKMNNANSQIQSESKSGKNPRLNLKHFRESEWYQFVYKIRKHMHRCQGPTALCNLCTQTLQHEILILEKHPAVNTKIKDDGSFDMVLSFYRQSITIQQLYQYSTKFARFLRPKSFNEPIQQIMEQYHQYIPLREKYVDSHHAPKEHQKMMQLFEAKLDGKEKRNKHPKQKHIDKQKADANTFIQQYFPNVTVFRGKNNQQSEFQDMIEWLYQHSETLRDFCNSINLFWLFEPDSEESKQSKPHGKMILKIYDFMQKAEHMDGTYTLSAEEFSLWKLDLGISEAAARRLFYIVRHEMRSLSLKQFHRYFVFLLRMKYHVQRAILKSQQREDTTVSISGLKMELEMESDAEAQWLFDKVDEEHEGRLTWKQIVEYLETTLSLRKNMKDFFHEEDQKKKYKEKSAEIMFAMKDKLNGIHNKGANNMPNDHGTVMDVAASELPPSSIQQLEAILQRQSVDGQLDFDAFDELMQRYSVGLTASESKRIFDHLKSESCAMNNDPERNVKDKKMKFAPADKVSVSFLLKNVRESVPIHRHLSVNEIFKYALLTISARYS